jgi:hypothetical protein
MSIGLHACLILLSAARSTIDCSCLLATCRLLQSKVKTDEESLRKKVLDEAQVKIEMESKEEADRLR